VPRLRSAVYLDYRLPFAPGLSLLGGWRYATRWNGHALTLRLNVDNVFNRFYWRDTGSSGGDSYLFPGAPRLARLSLTVAF
jgi:iron complex outermembrane receptor protein